MRLPLARLVARRRSRLRPLVAGLALLAAAGCGGDGATGPDGEVAGTYNIVQVNDDTTSPFTVAQLTAQGSTFRLEIVRGSLDLNGDGSYSTTATTRVTVDGRAEPDEVSPPQTGRYTVNGNTVTFNPSGNDPEEPNFTAEHSGDTLTLADRGEDPLTGAPVTITIVARR